MTEQEKTLSGELHLAPDPELVRARTRARGLARHPLDGAARGRAARTVTSGAALVTTPVLRPRDA